MFKNRRIDWESQQEQPAEGLFLCQHCRHPLFSAQHKFDSKTGFPSFWAHIGDNVRFHELTTYGRQRTQLLCAHCGHHLGHLFEDPRTPSQVRYCINTEVLRVDQDV